MANVFDDQRTLFSVVLRPIEGGIYAVCGVNDREEQHWTLRDFLADLYMTSCLSLLAWSFS